MKQIIILNLTNEEKIGIDSNEIEEFIDLKKHNLNIQEKNLIFGFIPLRSKIYQVLNLDILLKFENTNKDKYNTLILYKNKNISFLTNKILNVYSIEEKDKLNFKNKNSNKIIEYFIKIEEELIPVFSIKTYIEFEENKNNERNKNKY